MRLAKRVMAVALSAAMLVSGLYVGQTASAQVSYETESVFIDTDSVPDDTNIKVTKGTVPQIKTKTNVKFTLDCNVDCTWEVSNIDVQDETKPKVSIDTFGNVSVPAEAAAGTYTITATGKNITNTDKTATCKIIIESTDQATGKITLDKELIEAQYAQYDVVDQETQKVQKVVEVAENGESLTVNGRVQGLKLYTKISPDYLLNDTVTFRSNKTEAATIASRDLLTTKTKTTNDGVTLSATCGNDIRTQDFPLYINERAYKASIDCQDIPAGDKNTTDHKYTVRLNEDIHFQILDNEEITLGEVTTNPIKWTLEYGDGTAIGATDTLTAGNGTIQTDLGDFVFADGGKSINLKTPIDNKDSAAYQAYVSRLDGAGTTGKDTIKLSPELSYQIGSQQGSFSLHAIRLDFTKNVNAFEEISMDFALAGLTEGIDYSVKEETINDKKEKVYYFESAESSKNVLDLAEATKSNFLGVRDFEEAKDADFKTGKYEMRYTLQEVPGLEEMYQNTELLSSTNTEIDDEGKYVTTTGRTLTKKGIGYFRLHLIMQNDTKVTTKDCIMRFVSSAENLLLRHTSYTTAEKEYNNQAVIHIRRGEADKPSVYLGSEEVASVDITATNPFIEFTVPEVIKGTGKIATADIDSKGKVKISGLRKGKVRVRATSVVDSREFKDYLLYVNDEVLALTKDQLEIDTSEAVKIGKMNVRDQVQGHQVDVPLKIKVNDNNAAIPEVQWSIPDDTQGQFATIDADTGLLTSLKSTGSTEITVRATCVSDSTIYVEKKIQILDVPAERIVAIGEKVAPGATGVVESSGDLAGTAKVGERFILEPKSFEPSNATSVSGGIKWTSGKTDVATVDEGTGMVTTLSEGQATIVATYTSNTTSQSVTYNLTVSGFAERVTSISVGGDVTLTRVGMTYTLVPTVLPATVSDKSVIYEVTEGKDIVSVTENGVITALKAGTATIKITSKLTPTVSTTVRVVVKGENDDTPSTPTPTPTPTPPVNNTPAPTTNVPAKNTKVKSAGSTYVVTNASAANGEVALQTAKKAKSVKVADTVTVNGKKYKVTSIKANAFKGNKNLTSVTIGKNVKTIEKNAFNGCKKLTKVIIKSTVLKKVGAKAFAKGSKKITVTVPKKKANAYKKLLKKAGISAKAKYKKK